jgi:phosphatidylinositol alpha-1,6-mannosyltransferase
MKVLFLSWNFPPTMGGMEYVAENLFESLNAGHRVSALVPWADDERVRHGVERASGRGIAAYVRFVFGRGWRLCRQERPDVMLCVSVVPGLPAVVLSRMFRIPVVILVHGSDVLHPGFLYQRVIRLILRCATLIAANSCQTKKFMVDAGFNADRIEVIYPGVRVGDFLRSLPSGGASELASLTANRKVILTVGRLIQRKGVLQFVEQVMPDLVKRHPDVLYLVVGDDARQSLVHHERLRDRIAGRIDALGLGSHVRLMGSLSSNDLLELYRRAHLFVLPCLDIPGDVEGFGIVFSEAALAGIPSVATRVGGIPEAIVDGETGILVAPGDYTAMLDAVGGLLADSSRSRRLADAGKERATRELSWDTITNQYLKLLERAIAGYGRVSSSQDRAR